MFVPLMVIAVAVAQDVQAPAFYAANDELRQYLIEAAQNNPGLKARHAEWRAALEKVPQVTSLDDPMFGYTQFLQSEQYIAQLMLEQKFPWFGTLRTRGDKATLEASAALARLYAARNQLFAQVKNAYFEYAFLGESVKIVDSQTGILSQLEDVIRARYSVGAGTQADLLRIQTERDKLDDQLKGLKQARPALAARLLESLGRQGEPELDWPQPTELPPLPPHAQDVLVRIRTANPNLEAMQDMIESWEEQARLARKAGYPDFSVGLQYMFMKDRKTSAGTLQAVGTSQALKEIAAANDPMTILSDISNGEAAGENAGQSGNVKDAIAVSLRVNVPIWRKRVNAGIREAERMRESAEYDKLKSTLSYDTAARTGLYNFEDAGRRYRLYKEVLIPRERQIFETLLATYSAGVDPMEPGAQSGTEFLDLENSLRAILEFQIEQARASRDLQVAAAELEMLMGGPWADGDTAAQGLPPSVVEAQPAASNDATNRQKE